MRKKLAATLTIAIFLISTFAIIVPTQATFTLGNLQRTYPYDVNNFDPHVPGVIGYVWPGSGECAYLGYPNQANRNNCAPGYQSPYPNGNPPGAPSNSWYQLESNSYEPFGAVLTGSTGDLIFALNATACQTQGAYPTGVNTCSDGLSHYTGTWDYLQIYLPPGFTAPDGSQVVTSFTNNYAGIFTNKVSPYDRFGPGDTIVTTFTDAGQDAPSNPSAIVNTYYQHQGIQFTQLGEWYYIRINGVTAPTTAGRYFFKILLGYITDSYLGGEEGTNQARIHNLDPTQFVPTENWPVLLVKGEVDPAIITGTIRYAGYNQTLYSLPVKEAGRVYAKMTTRLDPYTGQARSDLPLLDAVGYFNATAQGHYEVEGVASGVYDLYASAAGYPQTLIASKVTILKGQSLHFDGYLQPGPVIHGNVFTKHQFGDEPWPETQYMKIELYDAPTLNHIPDSSAKLVSWSPLPCVAGGQEYFYPYNHAALCNDPRNGGAVAFPWHEYTPSNGYGWPSSSSRSYYQVSAPVTGELNPSNVMTTDPMGVGPPQQWYVLGGGTTPFHFEFGVKGEYGAPRDLDGGVPQVYATWVNGLTPGRYYVRAWTFRYVQSALDGSTFQEYYFDVTPNEWAGDVTVPIDLRLSSWVNETVHFHDSNGTIVNQPIDTGAGAMSGVLVDANGNVWSYNQTVLGYYGWYSSGPQSGYNWNDNSYRGRYYYYYSRYGYLDLDPAKLNAFSIETGIATLQFWGWNDTWGGENYGIPSGTYTAHVFTLGYIESSLVNQVSVTLSGNPTSISNHMYRGVGFNLAIYSIDWEKPTVARNWVYGQWGVGPTIGGKLPPGVQESGQLPYTWGEGYTASGMAVGGTSGCTGTNPHPGTTQCGPFSSNPNLPAGWAAMVGQEIDVGIYNKGSLIDYIGDQLGSGRLADTTPSTCLFQNDTTSFVRSCGGGWNPTGANLFGRENSYTYNANGAYFGMELQDLGYVGGITYGVAEYSLGATKLFGPAYYTNLRTVPGTVNALYDSNSAGTALYPSALPGGLQYDLHAYTYGYVQDQVPSAYAASCQVADVRINMVIGVNITLNILFKKENIITPTDKNMSARVRLFNDQGTLVAEWMSSEGTYTQANGFATAANGQTQYPFNNLGDNYPNPSISVGGTTDYGPNGVVPYPNMLNGYNYLPGGVTELSVLMAGIPQVPAAGMNDGPDAGYYLNNAYFGDPAVFFGFGCYFSLWCYPSRFPNSGIVGASEYQGGWTAEVDFVPWYANNTSRQEAASGGFQLGSETPSTACPSTTTSCAPFAQYYAPVSGLLFGESYHIIPGTKAGSGVSLTEDYGKHSMAANHLGPYSQRGVWQISNAHLSGEASGIFEVDLNGLVSGNVLAFTWSNEFRPLTWGMVTVASPSYQANHVAKTVSSVNGASIDTGESPPFGTGAGKFVAANSEYLSIPNSSSDFNFGSKDFTIDFWVKFNSLPSVQSIIGQYQNSGNDRWWIATAGKDIYFQDYASGSAVVAFNTITGPLSTGSWYHVAVVRSGSNWYIFVNGTQLATTTSSSTIATLTSSLYIGQQGGGGDYLDGWLKEVRVSNGIARWTSNFTLPTAEYTPDQYTVLLLHMDGTNGSTMFTDSNSGPVNNVANHVAKTVSSVNGASIDTGESPPFGTGAGKFVAANSEYLSIPNSSSHFNFGSNDFTIDFWVKFNSLPSTEHPILFLSQCANASRWQGLTLSNGSGTYYLQTQVAGESQDSVPASLTTGVWYHIAYVISRGKYYIFLNGTLLKTGTNDSPYQNLNAPLLIGSYNGGNLGVDGWLKEFRVSDGVARWTSDFTLPTAEYTPDQYTVLLLHMDGTNGSTMFTDSNSGPVNVEPASSLFGNFYTYDGVYQAFLPTGQYSFTIRAPGYAPQTWSVSIAPGQTGTGQNVYLEQSQIPVPEFSGAAVVAFSALAASVYLVKRIRK